MIKLSCRDEYFVLMHEKGSIVVDNEKYFFKKADNRLMELVVERLAKIVNLHSAHYEIVEINGELFYFSKDLSMIDEYKSAYDLFGEVDTIPDIRRLIERDEPVLLDYLSFEVVKMYLFDLIVMNYDRNSSNWGIRFARQGIDLCIIDNDLSFTLPMCTISARNKVPYMMRKYVEDDSLINDSYREIQFFLENYYDLYIELFYLMFNRLTPSVVAQVMKEVEEETTRKIEEKDKMLKDFENHYGSLSYFIDKYKGAQKKNAI